MTSHSRRSEIEADAPRAWISDMLGSSPEAEVLIRHVERLEAELAREHEMRAACQRHHMPMIERCGERIGELEAEVARLRDGDGDRA